MPVLELVMDATGMQRGQQQAETALKGVQDAATKTQASVTAIGGSLRNTFQVVGGVSQVGQGIAQAASAFSALNVSAGAFAASRVLLEVSKTTQDFKEMAFATGGATSAWSVLGTVIRTHPILTLATVLGAAAGMMSLLSSNTRKAASEFEDLVAAMNKARISDETARFLGLNRPGARTRELESVAEMLIRTGPGTATAPTTYSIADFQELVGARSRGGLTTDLLKYDTGFPNFVERQQVENIFQNPNWQIGQTRIPYNVMLGYVRGEYQAAQPGRGRAYDYSHMRQVPFGLEGDATSGEVMTRAMESARQQEESMARAAQYARQIGDSLGGVAWDVLAGVQSLRQALASLINQFGRQGLSSLGANLFGSTTRQATGNTNPMPGELGPFSQ